jgi:hypothetical protein
MENPGVDDLSGALKVLVGTEKIVELIDVNRAGLA